MNLVKAKEVLKRICESKGHQEPNYIFVKMFEKSEHGNSRRQFYEYCVMIGDQVFSGEGLSRRNAKRVAAYEAIKHLRFKYCRIDAVSELTEICSDHGLPLPIYTVKCTDQFYCYSTEIQFNYKNRLITLNGKGSIDSMDLAKEAAAKEVLDQLIELFGYFTDQKIYRNK